MRNMTVKSPMEENLWWEGDDLYVRDEQDRVWMMKDAQIVEHTFDPDPAGNMVVESVPLTFDRPVTT